MNKTMLLSTCVAACMIAMGGVAAKADMLAALSGDANLSIIESKTQKITKTIKVTGVSGRIAGIDVRPADGLLYAVTTDGTVYTIDHASGAASLKVKLETMVAPGPTIVDFNPVADRLRLIGADGTSLRANVDDGKVVSDKPLNYAETDGNKARKPAVIAGAYSNSVKGTKETALYDIDGAIGAFLKQVPPNDGRLTTIGDLGFKASDIAFDIVSDGQGGNIGYALSGGRLYTIDIATGKSTALGSIQNLPKDVRDVAVIGK